MCSVSISASQATKHFKPSLQNSLRMWVSEKDLGTSAQDINFCKEHLILSL